MKKIVAFNIALVMMFLTLSTCIFAVANDDDILYENNENSQASLNSIVVPNVESTFSHDSGGTLYLTYIGEPDLVANVFYNQITYFSQQQVSILQEICYSPSAISWLESLPGDVFTEAIITTLASYIATQNAPLSFLLGFSISKFLDFISKLEQFLLSDAVANSTTGKVKFISMYAMSSFGYFEYIHIFQPWNDSNIEIFSDYKYSWLPNVYHYNSGFTFDCTHDFSSYVDAGPFYHTRWCKKCNHIEENIHQYGTWFSISGSKHQTNCVTCNHAKTGYHKDSYDLILGKCTLCGHVGMIQLKQKMHLFDA